eukprot:GHVH01009827.1.p1 GENE.GHVH01009827.1~~GHVH01009827.1.p1  ORF type:complete len:108 (+),score=5.59 GHVH01009827.1:430-753(+)
MMAYVHFSSANLLRVLYSSSVQLLTVKHHLYERTCWTSVVQLLDNDGTIIGDEATIVYPASNEVIFNPLLSEALLLYSSSVVMIFFISFELIFNIKSIEYRGRINKA